MMTLAPGVPAAETTDAPVPATTTEAPWTTVVWNDPVNLMTYVSWVFRTYFRLDRAVAKRRMMQVHEDGRATLASGPREEMERHVQAMHGYGLWATVEKGEG